VSGERAFCEGVHGFEELARGLPAIGETDVNLEVRLAASQGQPPHFHPGALRDFEQRVGVTERRGAGVMHDHSARRGGLGYLPIPWDAGERVAARPAREVERFELERRGSAQNAADDERVAAAAQAAERPPGQIARLEEYQHCCPGQLGFALVYHELYDRRAEPAHGGPLAEHGQAALHPAQGFASKVNVADRAGGEPGDERDRGGGDESRHGGRDDSTPARRGWRSVLREFLYGMFTYEIVQEVREMRGALDRLFILGLFGDMLGVPILPPYYGLRLLPFVVPQIETWKRSVLRERELGSDHEHHLHGV
jgi:hypothetical protein